MTLFSRTTLARSLVLSYAAVILVFLAVSGVTLWAGMQMAKTEQVNIKTYRAIGNGTTMLQAMTEYVSLTRGAMVNGQTADAEHTAKLSKDFETAWNSAKELTAGEADQHARLDEMRAQMKQLVDVNSTLIATRLAVKEGVVSFDDFLARFSEGKDDALIASFRAKQAEFGKKELTDLYTQLARAETLRQFNLLVVVGGACLAILAAAAMAFFGVRRLRASLGGEPAYAANVAREIADGNLLIQVDTRPGDSTSVLAAMKAMRDRLAGIVGDVRRTADGVSVASAEIAAGNADLSSRTEQQASALEETAASMEELGSTVSGNAENARQANQLALAASSVAAQGGEAVGHVVETMKGISESSRRIADIIGVIDGIAFQTNILALNAAVEAARAGEQGRGFAVVASEVRSLAQRSAEAAKEIKSLITASVEQVEQGTAQVDRAGATIGEVVASIRRVTDIVGEISAASIEQAAGVGQVAEAVTEMDRATQQNAALVEQSAAAAESLKSQATQLVNAMAVFRVASAGAAAPVAAALPRMPAPAVVANEVIVRAASAAKTPARSTAARTGSDEWESF